MSEKTTQQETADRQAPANELLEALGTTISPDLLVQALTHRSFSHEHPGVSNYERLEFLGDAVLELVTTETLFTIHPDMNEGQLAKMRAKAVSEDALSAIAKTKLKVGPYILLGHGEAEQGGAEKNSILCDIVESLITPPSWNTVLMRPARSFIGSLTTPWRKWPPKARRSTGKPR